MRGLRELISESAVRHASAYRASNGRWYLDLAEREYGEPEDAQTYGPFNSLDQVHDFLETVPDPGGVSYDSSGQNPPPTSSPNGRPVKFVSGKGAAFSASDSDMHRLVQNYVRMHKSDFGDGATMPNIDQLLDDIADRAEREGLKIDWPKLRVAAEEVLNAPDVSTVAVPPAPEATPAMLPTNKPAGKSAVKTSYKVYGGTGGTGRTPPGASSIHTRIKGKVFMPTAKSQFGVGDAADVTVSDDGKTLTLKKPDGDHTQTWAAREGVERVIRQMIKLLG